MKHAVFLWFLLLSKMALMCCVPVWLSDDHWTYLIVNKRNGMGSPTSIKAFVAFVHSFLTKSFQTNVRAQQDHDYDRGTQRIFEKSVLWKTFIRRLVSILQDNRSFDSVYFGVDCVEFRVGLLLAASPILARQTHGQSVDCIHLVSNAASTTSIGFDWVRRRFRFSAH